VKTLKRKIVEKQEPAPKRQKIANTFKRAIHRVKEVVAPSSNTTIVPTETKNIDIKISTSRAARHANREKLEPLSPDKLRRKKREADSRLLVAGHKYEGWKWGPLKDELQSRKMKISGSKEDMVIRLIESDAKFATEGVWRDPPKRKSKYWPLGKESSAQMAAQNLLDGADTDDEEDEDEEENQANEEEEDGDDDGAEELEILETDQELSEQSEQGQDRDASADAGSGFSNVTEMENMYLNLPTPPPQPRPTARAPFQCRPEDKKSRAYKVIEKAASTLRKNANSILRGADTLVDAVREDMDSTTIAAKDGLRKSNSARRSLFSFDTGNSKKFRQSTLSFGESSRLTFSKSNEESASSEALVPEEDEIDVVRKPSKSASIRSRLTQSIRGSRRQRTAAKMGIREEKVPKESVKAVIDMEENE